MCIEVGDRVRLTATVWDGEYFRWKGDILIVKKKHMWTVVVHHENTTKDYFQVPHNQIEKI